MIPMQTKMKTCSSKRIAKIVIPVIFILLVVTTGIYWLKRRKNVKNNQENINKAEIGSNPNPDNIKEEVKNKTDDINILLEKDLNKEEIDGLVKNDPTVKNTVGLQADILELEDSGIFAERTEEINKIEDLLENAKENKEFDYIVASNVGKGILMDAESTAPKTEEFEKIVENNTVIEEPALVDDSLKPENDCVDITENGLDIENDLDVENNLNIENSSKREEDSEHSFEEIPESVSDSSENEDD